MLFKNTLERKYEAPQCESLQAGFGSVLCESPEASTEDFTGDVIDYTW